MLKTLRITSLAAVILAVCGVIAIAVFGFRSDPEIKALLETPSVTEKFKGQESKADKKEGDIHPLVTEAKAFALRINPPPPPPPPAPKTPVSKPAANPQLTRKPVAPPPPPPPPPASFQVLATVRYETEPSRSLALLKSGNSFSWFRQGEKAGHLTIDEVRDGSIVVSQAGRSPQTLFVPVKQESKSLLKGDKTAVASARPSTAGLPGAVASTASFAADDSQETGRPVSPSVRPRTLTSRVGRVRAQPPVPTPEEKQAELDQTISGLQEIMNRQDDSLSAEQRQAENQMWMELLNALKSEKDSLAAVSGEQPGQTAPEEGGESSEEQASVENAESGQVPAEPAQAEGEGEGEVPAEAGTEQAPVESEGEGQSEDEGNAEGFGAFSEESGEGAQPEFDPAEGAEGDPSGGFGAEPNEY